jgi:CheY-like chemotaxis protein
VVEKNGRKILVVEDEPFICRVCVRTLEAEGFEVDTAGNGLAALEMTGKKKYDLIVSDIRTPEMNGIDFFRRLREKDPVLANRIIFTSGDVMSPDVKEFMSTNQNPFLPKPFMPDELRAIVRKTMGNAPPATAT